jgi:hypothetical protein
MGMLAPMRRREWGYSRWVPQWCARPEAFPFHRDKSLRSGDVGFPRSAFLVTNWVTETTRGCRGGAAVEYNT